MELFFFEVSDSIDVAEFTELSEVLLNALAGSSGQQD